MVRYHIRVKTGDNNKTHMYWFIHKDHATMTNDEMDEQFDKAVKELNRVYQTYGRFATTTGVVRLFNSFGFEQTISN